jgi:hypothetical protein
MLVDVIMREQMFIKGFTGMVERKETKICI